MHTDTYTNMTHTGKEKRERKNKNKQQHYNTAYLTYVRLVPYRPKPLTNHDQQTIILIDISKKFISYIWTLDMEINASEHANEWPRWQNKPNIYTGHKAKTNMHEAKQFNYFIITCLENHTHTHARTYVRGTRARVRSHLLFAHQRMSAMNLLRLCKAEVSRIERWRCLSMTDWAGKVVPDDRSNI